MNRFRPLVLAAATLLFISACSMPEDLGTPALEPQFGSADEDIGVDVAFVSTGRIYSLSRQFGPIYAETENGTSYESGEYEKALLRRYDSSGNTVWTIAVDEQRCEGDPFFNSCVSLGVHSLTADSQGNVYTLTSSSSQNTDQYYDAVFTSYTVTKYNASGNYVDSAYVNNAIEGPEGDYVGRGSSAVAVDAVGNIHAAGTKCYPIEGEEGYTAGGDCSNVVAKYSTTGALQWQRTSTVGTPTDITVSGSGSVYVVGTVGLARYSSSGGLTWTKPGDFEEVIVSGSNLYTRYRKDIRKYDGNGKQLWLRSQSGLNTMVFQDMTGDGSGNVYLSGKYAASASNFNAMTRKLNSSGTVLWTKPYGTTAYDDARGVATINGSEIYTTGETQGSLAHTNIGGRDGYLRKLNSSGNPIWTR